ncbi:hypothetical protein DERP_009395 [Dermatophagoides pteronyssinus]|uniref:Uncharacterized protein n=1 Tax=Dermatophagoides pteronyssinus TaxID=6956 RepID=A0ABQ8ITP7_DERPT|nr:hypothetical protein DERP_009395 [Dermatophagoides pteronyssinus]
MYTIFRIFPCLAIVMIVSAAVLRHIELCSGHHDVITLNNNIKSSLRVKSFNAVESEVIINIKEIRDESFD